MDFDIYAASAVKATNTGTFGPTIALANVGVCLPASRQTGNDGGSAYGAQAAIDNLPISLPTAAITNLGQLSPGTNANRGISAVPLESAMPIPAGTNIMPQCVRFNATYTLPAVDLSAGAGSADIDVSYDFYQRP